MAQHLSDSVQRRVESGEAGAPNLDPRDIAGKTWNRAKLGLQAFIAAVALNENWNAVAYWLNRLGSAAAASSWLRITGGCLPSMSV